MKKTVLFCCFFLLIICRSFAQAYYFDHLKSADGLSNNAVLCSVQDKNGFLWFGTKDGLNRYDGYTFKQYFNDIELQNGLASNYITTLFVDERNHLWVGTDRGLYLFDPSGDYFQVVKGTESREIISVEEDRNGAIWWIADYRLFRLDQDRCAQSMDELVNGSPVTALGKNKLGEIYAATFKKIVHLREGASIAFPIEVSENWHVECLTFDHRNQLWIGTQHHGVIRVDINKQKFVPVPSTGDTPVNLFVRDIKNGEGDQLWIATESGLILMNTSDHDQVLFRYQRDNPWSLSDNAVYCVTVDHQGGVWAGSFFGGVNYLHYKHSLFERIFPLDQTNSLSGRAVRELRMDAQQNIWIGTEDQGLNYWDRRSNKFAHFSNQNGLSHNNIHGLELVGDSLLVGTFNSGLDIIDTRSKRIIGHYSKESTNGALGDNFVMSIIRTRKERVLICTPKGVYDFTPGVDRFQKLSSLPDSIFYTSAFQDHKGHLWFTTWRDGVYRIDGNTQEVSVFHHDPDDSLSLNSNRTNRVHQDSKDNIWIATENGFSVWDQNGKPIKRFTKRDGLPSNLILAFAEDGNQNMWISTSYGLISVSLDDYKIRVFNKEYGLSDLQFNYNSVLKSPDGVFYFGSTNGLIRFHPDSILTREQVERVPIYVTSARSAGRELPIRDSVNDKQFTTPHYDALIVDHDESSLQIDFAALNFIDAASTRYLYRLEGFDEQWIRTTQNRAYYTKLPPGMYTLHIQATDAQGQVITRELILPIRVNKPWWLSGGAVAVYLLCGVLLIYLGFRYFDAKIKESNRRKIQELNASRERRLYQAKLDFFSQVAHDIKTPLTLIKGPLEKLVGGEEIEEERGKRLLRTMYKNTDKLVRLTNSILDFRKIEIGGNSLKRESMNISEFVNNFVRDYQLSFQTENKSLSWTISEDIIAKGDADVLTKILENLLSNALKYAEKTARLILEKDSQGHFWKLSIKNDGHLLDAKEKDLLFKPFHRTAQSLDTEGTGLGLALAQSFARLHGGDLTYIENSEKLNIFVLTMPINPN